MERFFARACSGGISSAVFLIQFGLWVLLVSPASAQVRASIETDQRARMLALYKEEREARTREGGAWSLAATGLESCAAAREMSDREQTCKRAQRYVEDCIAARDDWVRRKRLLLTEVRAGDPNLGKTYAPGVSVLRGAPNSPDAPQRWNDAVRGLESMEIASCPTTLPGTSLTPDAALQEWTARDTPAPALPPRRGGLAATDRFRDLNAMADNDQRNPDAREARLKAEREEQARLEREYAGRKNSDEVILSTLSTFLGALTQAQTQRNPTDPGLAVLSRISGQAGGVSTSGDSSLPAVLGGTSASPDGASASAVSCDDALNSLIGPMNEGRPPTLGGSYGAAQDAEQSVWAMRVYLQVANALPACASSSAPQTVAQNLARAQSDCQRARGVACMEGRNYHVNVPKLEGAIKQLQQDGAPAQVAAPQRAGGSAAVCEEAYRVKDAELGQLFQRASITSSVVVSSQRALYMMDEMQKVLESPACAGPPGRYRREQLAQTRLSTVRSCRGVATNPNDCVARWSQ